MGVYRKIGEEFTYEGIRLRVKQVAFTCCNCHFDSGLGCIFDMGLGDPGWTGSCINTERPDNCNVIFEKVEC